MLSGTLVPAKARFIRGVQAASTTFGFDDRLTSTGGQEITSIGTSRERSYKGTVGPLRDKSVGFGTFLPPCKWRPILPEGPSKRVGSRSIAPFSDTSAVSAYL